MATQRFDRTTAVRVNAAYRLPSVLATAHTIVAQKKFEQSLREFEVPSPDRNP